MARKRNPADAEAFTVLHSKIGAVNSLHEGDVVRREDLPEIPRLLEIGAIRPATEDELDRLEEEPADEDEDEPDTEDAEDEEPAARGTRGRAGSTRGRKPVPDRETGRAGRVGTDADLTDGDGSA